MRDVPLPPEHDDVESDFYQRSNQNWAIVDAANHLVPLLNERFTIDEAVDNVASAIVTAYVYSTADHEDEFRAKLAELLLK